MSTELAFDRMPHSGKMLLLDQVLSVNDTSIRCRAKLHTTLDYPLRVNGRIGALALVELGAQAAAAHASLHGIGNAHAGLLLSLRNVGIAQQDIEAITTPLHIAANRLHADESGARYRFEIKEDELSTAEVLSGEAMLSMRAVR